MAAMARITRIGIAVGLAFAGTLVLALGRSRRRT